MSRGMELGFGPGDFVLDGDPAPRPQKGGGRTPNFRPMSIVVKRLDGLGFRMLLGMAVHLGPGHIELVGDPAPRPQKGGGRTPNFRPMFIVAKRLDE